ncbi:lytic transglycosylase domain-containing protein [Nocardioides donggukensis]|uniref:Lytic transglycosylase domain-containing protein n=1 Tax=Nocardioides donggukensis TaxID=2774019 RepID=A0A927KBG9_9ACTN|nr:lytic transglycosylase domain-containing protein [Nocardioides donggukensis]MBD8871120.1 lytic transglycosylase domain-containing protein [Nocardioides donggukensis]
MSRRTKVAMSIALAPLTALAAASPGASLVLAADRATPAAATAEVPPVALPTLPDAPLDDPASRTAPPRHPDRGTRSAPVAATVSTASTAAIPDVALAAYQRAEAVMRATDPSCNLDWELLAAIGRVESDHGRYAGSRLTASGVARPAVLGPRLDGRGGFARLPDTDAGALDGDRRFERAVGPMQFIPGTWREVGVDADGDGRRNPQDIDDAALAAGVYLCVGEDNLGTDAGQRAALLRYNRSHAYVRVVLGLFDRYSATPGSISLRAREALPVTVGAVPLPDVLTASGPVRARVGAPGGRAPGGPSTTSGRGKDDDVRASIAPAPSTGGTKKPKPTVIGSEPPKDADPGPTEEPTEEPTDGPTEEPTEEPTDGPTDGPTEEPTGEPGDETGTPEEPPAEETSTGDTTCGSEGATAGEGEASGTDAETADPESSGSEESGGTGSEETGSEETGSEETGAPACDDADAADRSTQTSGDTTSD